MLSGEWDGTWILKINKFLKTMLLIKPLPASENNQLSYIFA